MPLLESVFSTKNRKSLELGLNRREADIAFANGCARFDPKGAAG
jgi:hypothetical protein